jgi:CMP-N-acetylneuraminic acid synthetase
MKILGIIPARGGSKGVPEKNILQVDGKPLLAYAIACGEASEKISQVVVSTDSPEIEQVAKDYGAQVMLRPQELAADASDVADAVLFTLVEFQKKGEKFDRIVLLQPTAPLRTGKDIDKALNLLEESGNDAVISVVKVEDNHPARMYTVKSDTMTALHPEWEKRRRQELPEYYLRNGCIYAIKTKAFLAEKNLMPTLKSAYVMNEKWWINVDTPADFYLLERLMPLWKKENDLK